MEMLSSSIGDDHEFCLVVIKLLFCGSTCLLESMWFVELLLEWKLRNAMDDSVMNGMISTEEVLEVLGQTSEIGDDSEEILYIRTVQGRSHLVIWPIHSLFSLVEAHIVSQGSAYLDNHRQLVAPLVLHFFEFALYGTACASKCQIHYETGQRFEMGGRDYSSSYCCRSDWHLAFTSSRQRL